MPRFLGREALPHCAWRTDCVIRCEKVPEARPLVPILQSPHTPCFHPATRPASPLLLSKHSVGLHCRPRVHRLLNLWGGGYAHCVCVSRWGRGAGETEGPGSWAGAGGRLHFLVSLTPPSYCWNPQTTHRHILLLFCFNKRTKVADTSEECFHSNRSPRVFICI